MTLPAAVGELVAEMRKRADCLPGGCDWASVVEEELRKWADRLSALTAEAGKGLPVLPEPFDTVLVDDFSDRRIDVYSEFQMRDYARLALSTATPAGEWDSAVHEAARDYLGNKSYAYKTICKMAEEALAASPRGASAGGE